jgi:hypothetical protein
MAAHHAPPDQGQRVWYDLVAAGTEDNERPMRASAKMIAAIPMFLKDSKHCCRQHVDMISDQAQEVVDSIKMEARYHHSHRMMSRTRLAVKELIRKITCFFQRYGISFEVTAEDDDLSLEGLDPLMDAATLYGSDEDDVSTVSIDDWWTRGCGRTYDARTHIQSIAISLLRTRSYIYEDVHNVEYNLYSTFLRMKLIKDLVDVDL